MILEIYGSPTFISDTINCFRIYAFFCYYATVLRPIEITIYNNTALRNRVKMQVHQKQNGNFRLFKLRIDQDEIIIGLARGDTITNPVH